MIHYLHYIGEFWSSSAAKLFEWLSETLFLKNLLGGGRRTMALTKVEGFVMKSKRDGEEDELGLGLGTVRILMSSRVRKSLSRSAVEIPATESPPVKVKRQRSLTTIAEESPLESLPQELLIRVISGVDHEDLNSLNIVSKSIREASLIAKSLHFAYTTPKKTRQAFRNQIDLDDHQVEDIEPPNAPIHYRWTKAKSNERESKVPVALFT
ncbi:hypothetical protein EUTSA_v10026245mg [Eutrema salsugineum]|uniref:F-box domain-containing protein n=1 Tax=Eutrema salsugineum TaxID=72664 RepID=V4LX30_EUTSA|nr:F-box protein SKIP27 [Eutrema salsugineum]ESQ55225.1 hypothetical protein EUTSA_v10026245mg [Eutrema salsugineum]